MSDSRTMAERRPAAATSSSSPTLWPFVSLTTLKSSRSTNSTPVILPVRLAVATCCAIRSWNSSRLGSPVRASWKARCFSSSSSWCCPVTSLRVKTRPATFGSARRSLHLAWMCTILPSSRVIRSSTTRGPDRARSRSRMKVRASSLAVCSATRSQKRLPTAATSPKTATVEASRT